MSNSFVNILRMILIGSNMTKIIAISLLGILLIGSNSCKKITNPNKNGEVKDTLSYDFLNTRIFIEFFDANTNNHINSNGSDHLKVELKGGSKDAIADIIGLQKEIYYPENGFISFGILPEYNPSISSPINFTLIASINNYLMTSREIKISEVGDYYIKISMVNIDNPPEGIAVKTADGIGNLYDGFLRDDVEISTENEEAKITIHGGTRLLNSDTNNLNGKLNISLFYYNLDYDQSFESFSGGIIGTIEENNSIENSLFYPGGYVTIKVYDSDGKEGAFIESKSIDLYVKIASELINPKTGLSYQSGDIINLIRYDDNAGTWIYEKSDTVKIDDNGILYVNTTTASLNNISLSNYKINFCADASGFSITGNCQQDQTIQLSGILRKSDDDSFISNITLVGNKSEALYFSGNIGNNSAYIDWLTITGSCEINQAYNPTTIENMCLGPDVDINLMKGAGDLKSIEATFLGRCSSDTNYIILPSFGLWVKNIDAVTDWKWYSMEKGKAQIYDLTIGQTYIFGVYFDGVWKEWRATIREDSKLDFNIEFSDGICNDVFGIF